MLIKSGLFTPSTNLVLIPVFQVLVKGETISDDVISRLPYLKACVKESYRMYPTASQLARITQEEHVLKDGTKLPAYSVVLCHHR